MGLLEELKASPCQYTRDRAERSCQLYEYSTQDWKAQEAVVVEQLKLFSDGYNLYMVGQFDGDFASFKRSKLVAIWRAIGRASYENDMRSWWTGALPRPNVFKSGIDKDQEGLVVAVVDALTLLGCTIEMIAVVVGPTADGEAIFETTLEEMYVSDSESQV